MTSSEDLPITRREMRTFLDKARSVTVGRVGQNVIEDLYRLFILNFRRMRQERRLTKLSA